EAAGAPLTTTTTGLGKCRAGQSQAARHHHTENRQPLHDETPHYVDRRGPIRTPIESELRSNPEKNGGPIVGIGDRSGFDSERRERFRSRRHRRLRVRSDRFYGGKPASAETIAACTGAIERGGRPGVRRTRPFS